jgi:phosphoglycerate kinase
MAIVPVQQLAVESRRVLVRVDFNVPLRDGRVSDDSRIAAALPTIAHLLGRGARPVLCSHLGRPRGKVDAAWSLEPVGARLAELANAEVVLTDEPVGDAARKLVRDVKAGQIVLLENLRFDPREESNDDSFARELASLAEVYVNDAFGAAHRAHASVVAVTRHLVERGAGLLLLREAQFLGRLLGEVERPFVAILGGAKVSDKIGVIENLLARIDVLVLGGAMANTFLLARGSKMGASRVEPDRVALAASVLRAAAERKVTVLLPTDLVVAESAKAPMGTVVSAADVPDGRMALDIGPRSAAAVGDVVRGAKTVFWNGPMGVFEEPPFARGTVDVAVAVAACAGLTVVGGGDSVAALRAAGVEQRIGHVSTGGGASLEFIEGKELPGLKALA